MLTQEELNAHVRYLLDLQKEAERLSAQIEKIKGTLKDEMVARNEYELSGDDWKLSWHLVASKRFDQSLFKSKNPDMFTEYLTLSESRRFLLKDTKEDNY